MEDFLATVAERWLGGRDDYHWHVLPGAELTRGRLVRPYAELTSRVGLAPQYGPEHMIITRALAWLAGPDSSRQHAYRRLMAGFRAGRHRLWHPPTANGGRL